MTRTVLAENNTGAIVSYEDTPEERLERIEKWASSAAQDLVITPGQAALLRKFRRVVRDH